MPGHQAYNPTTVPAVSGLFRTVSDRFPTVWSGSIVSVERPADLIATGYVAVGAATGVWYWDAGLFDSEAEPTG
jgi:hypothetical protein